ncbi:Serine-threonine-isoleucine rich protein [Entamoeba marina]
MKQTDYESKKPQNYYVATDLSVTCDDTTTSIIVNMGDFSSLNFDNIGTSSEFDITINSDSTDTSEITIENIKPCTTLTFTTGLEKSLILNNAGSITEIVLNSNSLFINSIDQTSMTITSERTSDIAIIPSTVTLTSNSFGSIDFNDTNSNTFTRYHYDYSNPDICKFTDSGVFEEIDCNNLYFPTDYASFYTTESTIELPTDFAGTWNNFEINSASSITLSLQDSSTLTISGELTLNNAFDISDITYIGTLTISNSQGTTPNYIKSDCTIYSVSFPTGQYFISKYSITSDYLTKTQVSSEFSRYSYSSDTTSFSSCTYSVTNGYSEPDCKNGIVDSTLLNYDLSSCTEDTICFPDSSLVTTVYSSFIGLELGARSFETYEHLTLQNLELNTGDFKLNNMTISSSLSYSSNVNLILDSSLSGTDSDYSNIYALDTSDQTSSLFIISKFNETFVNGYATHTYNGVYYRFTADVDNLYCELSCTDGVCSFQRFDCNNQEYIDYTYMTLKLGSSTNISSISTQVLSTYSFKSLNVGSTGSLTITGTGDISINIASYTTTTTSIDIQLDTFTFTSLTIGSTINNFYLYSCPSSVSYSSTSIFLVCTDTSAAISDVTCVNTRTSSSPALKRCFYGTDYSSESNVDCTISTTTSFDEYDCINGNVDTNLMNLVILYTTETISMYDATEWNNLYIEVSGVTFSSDITVDGTVFINKDDFTISATQLTTITFDGSISVNNGYIDCETVTTVNLQTGQSYLSPQPQHDTYVSVSNTESTPLYLNYYSNDKPYCTVDSNNFGLTTPNCFSQGNCKLMSDFTGILLDTTGFSSGSTLDLEYTFDGITGSLSDYFKAPSTSFVSLTIPSSSCEVSVKDVTDITVTGNFDITAGIIDTLTYSSVTDGVIVADTVNTISGDSTFFIGKITTIDYSSISDEIGNSYYRFGKTDNVCTGLTTSLFEEFDCNNHASTIVNFSYMTLNFQDGFSYSGNEEFSKCTFDSTSTSTTPSVSNIVCSTLELPSYDLTIISPTIATINFPDSVSNYYTITGGTITNVDITTEFSSDSPIFYGSTTCSDSNIYSVEVASGYYRYYYGTAGDNICVYKNGFVDDDCSNSIISPSYCTLLIQSDDGNMEKTGWKDITINTTSITSTLDSNGDIVLSSEQSIVSITSTIKCENLLVNSVSASFSAVTVSDTMTVSTTTTDLIVASGSINSLNINSDGINSFIFGSAANSIVTIANSFSDSNTNAVFSFIGNVNSDLFSSVYNGIYYRYSTQSSVEACCTYATSGFEEWDCELNLFEPSSMYLVIDSDVGTYADTKSSSASTWISLSVDHEIDITDIYVTDLSLDYETCSVSGVLNNIFVNVDAADILISGSISSVTVDDAVSTSVLFLLSTDSVPSSAGVYFNEIGTYDSSNLYRVSTSDTLSCSISSGYSATSPFNEFDCNIYASYFTSSNLPTLTTTENINDAMTINILNWDTFTPSTSSSSFVFPTGTSITQFNALTTYSITCDSISTISISQAPTDAYVNVNNAITTITTSTSSAVLFVSNMEHTIDGYNSVQIATNYYRIAIDDSLYNYCTATSSGYSQFDCDLYYDPTDITPLNLLSEISSFDCSSKQFYDITLGISTNPTTAVTISNCISSGTISILSTDFTITGGSLNAIDLSTVYDSISNGYIDSTYGSILPLNIGTIYFLSTQTTSDFLQTVQVTESLYRHYYQLSRSSSCTLLATGEYEEWDCNTNYLSDKSYMDLVITTSVTIAESPFNSAIFDISSDCTVNLDTNVEFTTSISMGTVTNIVTITSTNSITTNELVLPSSYVLFNLNAPHSIQTVSNSEGSDYYFNTDQTSGLASAEYSQIDSTHYRVSGSSVLYCSINSNTNCIYVQPDCLEYGTSYSTLNFASGYTSIQCVDATYDSFSYTSSTSYGGESFSINNFDVSEYFIVSQLINVKNSLSFVALSSTDSIPELNLEVPSSITLSVTDSDGNPVTATTSTLTYFLFDGSMNDDGPSDINRESCANTVYYYKTDQAACICYMTSYTLTSTTGSNFEGDTEDACDSPQSNVIYSLQLKAPSTTDGVTIDFTDFYNIDGDSTSISYQRIIFNGNTDVTFTSNSGQILSLGTLNVPTTVTNIAVEVLSLKVTDSIQINGLFTVDNIDIGDLTLNKPIIATGTVTAGNVALQCSDTNRYHSSTIDCNCYYGDLYEDCKYDAYSQYYTLVSSTANSDVTLSISNIFNTISFSSNPSSVTVSGEGSLVTYSTQNFPSYINVDLSNIDKSGDGYTFIDTPLSTLTTSTTSSDYIFSSNTAVDISSIPYTSCYSDYYRYGSTGDIYCSCFYGDFESDCDYQHEKLNLVLSSSDITVTTAYTWHYISYDTTPASSSLTINANVDYLTLANPTDNECYVSGTGVIGNLVINSNTPYVYITNSITDVTVPSSNFDNVLFNTPTTTIVSSSEVVGVTCNSNIVRYFNDGTNVGCYCTITTDFDNKDCSHHSSNYELYIDTDSYTLTLQFISLTNLYDGASVTFDGGYVDTVYQNSKSLTLASTILDNSLVIVATGESYMYLDMPTANVEVDTESCTNSYCFTSANTISTFTDAGYSTKCGESYRISLYDYSCRCEPNDYTQIVSGDFKENDCNHASTDLTDFTLYVNTNSINFAESLSFAGFTISSITSLDISTTSSSTITLTSISPSIPITISGSVEFQSLTQTSNAIDVLSGGELTVDTLTVKLNQLFIFCDSGYLTVNDVVMSSSSSCVDIATSNSDSLITSNIANYASVLVNNGKQLLRVCTSTTPGTTVTCSILYTADSSFSESFNSKHYQCPCSASGESNSDCEYTVSSTLTNGVAIPDYSTLGSIITVSASNVFTLPDSFTFTEMNSQSSTLTFKNTGDVTIDSLTVITGSIVGSSSVTIGTLAGTSLTTSCETFINTVGSLSLIHTGTSYLTLTTSVSSTTVNADNLIVSASGSINTLTIKNNDIQFQNTIDVTISSLDVSQSVTVNPITLSSNGGKIVFPASFVMVNSFNYPIFLADVDGTVTDNTGNMLKCNDRALFTPDSSYDERELCIAAGYPVDNTDTSTECVVDLPCVLSISETGTYTIDKNYDYIICSETATLNFDGSITNAVVVASSTVVTIVGHSGLTLSLSGNSFAVTGPVTINGMNDCNIEVSGDVTLATGEFTSITGSGSIIVSGNIRATAISSVSVQLSSGSLIVDSLTTSSLDINEDFGLLQVGTLDLDGATVSASNYYNHDISSFQNCYLSDSIITAGSSTTNTYKCMTIDSNDIDLSSSGSYLNHYSHNCHSPSSGYKLYISSPSVILNKDSTYASIEFDSSLTTGVEFSGTASLTASIIGGVDVTYSLGNVILEGDGDSVATIECPGSVSKFNSVTINYKEETISVSQVSELVLQSTYSVSLTPFDSQSDGVTVISFISTNPERPYIEVSALDLSTISIDSSNTKSNVPLIHSSQPITGALNGYSLVCNKMYLYSDSSNTEISCSDIDYTASCSTGSCSYDPYQCVDNTNVNCNLEVTSVSSTVNLVSDYATSVTIDSLTTDVDLNLNSDVDTLIISEGNSYTVTLNYLPRVLNVNGATVKFTTSASNFADNIEITADSSSLIDITYSISMNFWKIVVDGTLSLTLDGSSSRINLLKEFSVNEFESTAALFFDYCDVSISSFTGKSYSSQNVIFRALSAIDNFVIDSFTFTDSLCVFVLDTRYITAVPSSVSIANCLLSNRIYYYQCSETDLVVKTCVAKTASLSSVDVHESTVYERPSVCPNIQTTMNLASISYDGSITVTGFESASYSTVILPSDVILSSVTTDVVTINALTVQNSVIFNNKFDISTLSFSQPISITVNSEVTIGTLSYSGSETYPISSIIVGTNGKLTVTGSIPNIYDITVTKSELALDFSTLDIYIGGSLNVLTTANTTSSIIQVSSISFASTTSSVSVAEQTGTVNIALIGSTSDMDVSSVSLSTNVVLVCNSKSLMFTTSESFACTDIVYCDTVDCARDTSGNTYTQQYYYTISSSNGNISLPENSGLVATYDVVEIDVSNTDVYFPQNSVYIVTGSGTGNVMYCANKPCYVVINTDSFISLTDGFIVQEDDSVSEDANANTLVIVESGVVSFEEIQSILLEVVIKSDAVANVTSYCSFESITSQEGSSLLVFDSFDCSNYINAGGVMNVSYSGAVADFDIITISESSLTTGCVDLLYRGYESDDDQSEKIFSFNQIVNEVDLNYRSCSGAVFMLCAADSFDESSCPSIDCDVDDSQREICFCVYDPSSTQSCTFSCYAEECTFVDDSTTVPFFKSIDVVTELFTLSSSADIYSLDNSDSHVFDIKTVLKIYQLSSESSSNGDLTFKNGELDIEILEYGSGSELVFATDLLLAKRFILNDASVIVNTTIEFDEDNEDIIEFDNKPETERLIEIIGSELHFGVDGMFNILGGYSSSDLGFVNNVTLRDVTIYVDRERSVDDYLFYLQESGIVEMNNVQVEFVGDELETPQCYVLLRNNDVDKITLTNQASNIHIDDQHYIVYVCDSGAVLGEISELACSLSSSFSSRNVTNFATSNWERSACPCEGDGCIYDFTKLYTATQELSDLQLLGYYVNNSVTSGENVVIDTYKVTGSSSRISATNCTIDNLVIDSTLNDTLVTLVAAKTINTISVSNGALQLTVSGGKLTTETMESADISLINGGSISVSSSADLSSKTLSVASNTFFDVYGDDCNFNNAEVTLSPTIDQSHQLNINDTVSSSSRTLTTLKSARISFSYDSSVSGVYALLRLPEDFSYKLSDFNIEATDKSVSVLKQASSFKLLKLCHGVVFTNVNEDDVVCPTDRLNINTEETVFPMYMIAVILVFVLVLVVVLIAFVVYFVHVIRVRINNAKLFDEGEELSNQQTDELVEDNVEDNADDIQPTTANEPESNAAPADSVSKKSSDDTHSKSPSSSSLKPTSESQSTNSSTQNSSLSSED